jgi:predicted outer membrane repeat protein
LTGTRCEANVGGGLVQERCSLFIMQSFFGFNVNSAGSGGAVHVTTCTVQVTNSSFVANSASQGGCIYALQSTLFLSNTRLTENIALGSGGAVLLDFDSTMNATAAGGECGFVNNTALYGGGGAAFSLGSSTTAFALSPACVLDGNSAAYGPDLATGTRFVSVMVSLLTLSHFRADCSSVALQRNHHG